MAGYGYMGGLGNFMQGVQSPWSRSTAQRTEANRRARMGSYLQSQMMGGGTEARAANEARYAEAKQIYDEIIGMFSPEGDFGKGLLAQLDRAKTKSVASGAQALVGSGLYGTTQAAGLEKKFEEEVGTPARLQIESERIGKYTEALKGKAGVIERREDEYPDYNMIAQLVRQMYGG